MIVSNPSVYDPSKIWIDSLMKYGGFITLLGIPALIAIASFIGRSRWLLTKRTPHTYGRTHLIYWPSQIFTLAACVILILFANSLVVDKHDSKDGLLVGIILTLIALIIALPLNELEHRYNTRSSNYLFAYYFTTLCTALITLYIILVDDYDQDDTTKYMAGFTAAIAAAFIFEAIPRNSTKVQRLAREKENLNEWQQANLFSRLSLHYFQPIVSLGASRPLIGDDLVNITPEKILTIVNYERVATYWDKEKTKSIANNKQPSFIWTVYRSYTLKSCLILVLRIIGYGMVYIPPQLLGQLLRFIDDYSNATREGTEPPPLRIGFVITTVMLFFSIASTFILTLSLQAMYEVGYQARAATIALIYRKSLRLSPQARQSCTLGEITNHMAVDAERWIEAALYSPFLITVPFQLVVAIYLLYQLLGWSLFAGLAVFCILVPIQARTAKFMNKFQDIQLKWMDSRLRLITELLSNIKIVKLYNWEAPMRKKIDDLRANELKAIKRLATVRSILNIMFSSVTLLMTLFTFCTFAYVGGPNMTPGKMTSSVIFVSITLFGTMSQPLGMAGHAISNIIAVRVAMKRIQKFLLMEEIDSTVVSRHSRPSQPPSPGNDTKKPLAVNINNGTFMWEKPVDLFATSTSVAADGEHQSSATTEALQAVEPTLSDITLCVPDGNLTAIVGRIGQGKSSLLSAIMGEMYKSAEGKVTVYGDLAYVPQQAWIINATVKDNILFGKPFDQEKYDRVIYASGLKPDFEMLAAGDQTEIGERGINLSGGQKQRVSLARAAYQDADIYLLDDPLSAVDAHVDQHLWHNLIGPGGLLKDKTRLLVTHGIHHLEYVDQIVVLKDGSISEQGKYQTLMDNQGAFCQLIKDFSTGKRKKYSPSKHCLPGITGATAGGSEVTLPGTGSIEDDPSDSEGDAIDPNTTAEEEIAKAGRNDEENEGGTEELIADEKMEEGDVGWRIVSIYAKAASYRKALTCIALFIFAQACLISTNFWLRHWVSDTETRERDGSEQRPVSYYLGGYGGLVALYMVLDVIVNYVAEVVCGISASTVLFESLLTRVLRMPMSFFDTTPMGRIVNRFSSDMNAIDMRLPSEWNDLFGFGSIIAGTLFVIAYSTPIFLVAIPPLFAIYFWVQRYFIKSSSSLKRLNSVSKSPLYQHFSETLTGVSSIRVMKGLGEQFVLENAIRGDVIINRTYAQNLDTRWLQIRLESLGGLTVFIAGSLSVWRAGTLDPSLVGLSLSYAFNMVSYLTFLVQFLTMVQNDLVSVERTDEYSQKPIEAPVETDVRLPPNWPAEGRIVFKNYSARYREGLDLVVKDISFTVEPTQSVGIVGRTGAGKSSLTLALFRIVEAADSYWARASDPSYVQDHTLSDDPTALFSDNNKEGGSIEIDGIDISTLGLGDLRQRLAIIPQDPTLFSGTIRDNLDPFGENTDNDLWEALERAHLKSQISALTGGLSYEVSQNGENFSVGQRSLICLARALLRKTKVLVLDEATAAVDVETDDLIQKTIRKEFKDRTILTIAHRIKTVMDSDKILVLEKGRVEEYESPEKLLERKDSLFYKLAEQAGEVSEH
ncbi:hypothetical protein BGX26_006959 [Mortierella sp. AD094]|nr:hypothetical protein BGX26_006959 [Mortierella sp. AD094]